LAIAEGVHELAEYRGALDLEQSLLVVVVRDLDIEVLALSVVLMLLLYVQGSLFRNLYSEMKFKFERIILVLL
jgi:hypothetical protein